MEEQEAMLLGLPSRHSWHPAMSEHSLADAYPCFFFELEKSSKVRKTRQKIFEEAVAEQSLEGSFQSPTALGKMWIYS